MEFVRGRNQMESAMPASLLARGEGQMESSMPVSPSIIAMRRRGITIQYAILLSKFSQEDLQGVVPTMPMAWRQVSPTVLSYYSIKRL